MIALLEQALVDGFPLGGRPHTVLVEHFGQWFGVYRIGFSHVEKKSQHTIGIILIRNTELELF